MIQFFWKCDSVVSAGANQAARGMGDGGRGDGGMEVEGVGESSHIMVHSLLKQQQQL